jgi:hypothetical protein
MDRDTPAPVPPRLPRKVRLPIEEVLRKDFASLTRLVRQVSPEQEPTPVAVQHIVTRFTSTAEHIDRFATDQYFRIGRLLVDLKHRLPHGGFSRLFLDGKPRLDKCIPWTLAKAEALMRLSVNRTLKDPEIQKVLPMGSWRTLDELARVEPTTLRKAARQGTIHPTMTRRQAIALRREEPPIDTKVKRLREALDAYEQDPATVIEEILARAWLRKRLRTKLQE